MDTRVLPSVSLGPFLAELEEFSEEFWGGRTSGGK
jgi:hypothetical protein